ncbi:MAG: hypothetical protein ABSA93_16995 [Streptosporangiaceae bacterium]|jgi:uncharacterized protein YukE
MGYGALIQEAVDDASDDMGTVQQAADAISAAIAKVTPLLGGQTWTGATANAWEAEWRSTYNSVQSVLADLPSAETSIVDDVRTQLEQSLEKTHAGT